MGNPLKIVIPYGRENAQLHFAQGNKEGDVTLCGRGCYGWSIARDFNKTDLDSAYSCARCVRSAGFRDDARLI